MTREPITNIDLLTCKQVRDRQRKFQKSKFNVRRGDYLKFAFNGARSIEHMWVKVKQVKDGKVVGIVNNDPVDTGCPLAGQRVEIPICFAEALHPQQVSWEEARKFEAWMHDIAKQLRIPVGIVERCMTGEEVGNERTWDETVRLKQNKRR